MLDLNLPSDYQQRQHIFLPAISQSCNFILRSSDHLITFKAKSTGKRKMWNYDNAHKWKLKKQSLAIHWYSGKKWTRFIMHMHTQIMWAQTFQYKCDTFTHTHIQQGMQGHTHTHAQIFLFLFIHQHQWQLLTHLGLESHSRLTHVQIADAADPAIKFLG